MGVVVRRYDILTIIINFPYSTCISSFFGSSIPTSCSFLNVIIYSQYNHTFIVKCFYFPQNFLGKRPALRGRGVSQTEVQRKGS